jgi:hypothetical protein
MTTKTGKRRKKQTKRPQIWVLLGLGGLLIVLAGVLGLFSQNKSPFVPEVSGAPKLTVDREVIDFGPVRMGKFVQASFTLTNTGDQPLSFSRTPYIEVLEGC